MDFCGISYFAIIMPISLYRYTPPHPHPELSLWPNSLTQEPADWQGQTLSRAQTGERARRRWAAGNMAGWVEASLHGREVGGMCFWGHGDGELKRGWVVLGSLSDEELLQGNFNSVFVQKLVSMRSSIYTSCAASLQMPFLHTIFYTVYSLPSCERTEEGWT